MKGRLLVRFGAALLTVSALAACRKPPPQPLEPGADRPTVTPKLVLPIPDLSFKRTTEDLGKASKLEACNETECTACPENAPCDWCAVQVGSEAQHVQYCKRPPSAHGFNCCLIKEDSASDKECVCCAYWEPVKARECELTE